MIDEAALQRLLDENEIRKLIHTYCRAVDCGDAELLRTLYHDDAHETHGAYVGGVEGFIDFAMRTVAATDSNTHHITTVLIDVDGDCAASESWFISFSAKLGFGEGEPIDLLICGRYLDQWERRDGSWKISRRLVAFDTNHTFPSSQKWDGPLYEGFRPRGRADAGDPVYDLLRAHKAAVASR